MTGQLNGLLYITAKDGNMYVVTLRAHADETSITKYKLKLLGTNETSDPLTPDMEGSGGDQLSPEKHVCQRLVYDVLHHYAYIAVETNIIVVHLNISMDTKANDSYLDYEVLTVGHRPDQIEAFKYGDDTVLLIHYYTPGHKGYVRRYRKYDNQVWADYGSPVLVTSPSWYDIDSISNTLLYKARDTYYDYDTLWVAVASRWYIHACSLIDGIYRTYLAPEPCDNITRLVYSHHRQQMLIECKEATVLFNAREKLFSAIWNNVVGTVYISTSGRYGAVVNITKSTITIIHLHHVENEGYRMIRLERTHGRVANATFVDVNSTQHYFCYFELQDDDSYYSIYCIDIELGFKHNNTSQFIRVSIQLPHSLTPTAEACTDLYTHHNLLLFQRNVCNKDNCISIIQVYDMTTLTNTYNITGVDPTFLAYKALSIQLPTELPTKIPNNTIDTFTTNTSDIVPTSMSDPVTMETQTSLSTIETTTPRYMYTPTHPEATPTSNEELLAHCTRELTDTKASYEQLLQITVLVCSLFCVALIITILLLVMVMCIAYRSNNRVTVNVEPGRYGTHSSPPIYSEKVRTET